MMVFQALLKPHGRTAPRQRRATLATRPVSAPPTDEIAMPGNLMAKSTSSLASRGKDHAHVISDEEQIHPLEAEDPDLRCLNNSLEALAAIFPNIQVEVFREMLSSFDEESRLAIVTEALLKNDVKWTQGRYRIAKKDVEPGESYIRRAEGEGVAREERFRSKSYRDTVRSILCQEFKGLSKSTVDAVLAESNYSYATTRLTLIDLSAKSWRYSLSSIFYRRRTAPSLSVDQHPLIIWQSPRPGTAYPTLKPTGCAELDAELYAALIAPWKASKASERYARDHELALQVNEREAEECQALHDCECCFVPTAFEELSSCSDDGHFICFRCLRHATNEAVFGQGWSRNVDLEIGSLRCIAPMADDCHGYIPYERVCRALADTKGGEETIRKFDQRLAEDNLLKTKLPLIRCPFCSYAEIDQLYLPPSHSRWRLKRRGPWALYTVVMLVFAAGMVPFLLPFLAISAALFLLHPGHGSLGPVLGAHFQRSLARLRRRQLGLKFTCPGERCGRASCLACAKAWRDVHVCHESSLTALRTQVELAMSLAVKRTCPRCRTSFVKASGCNKLTCLCGYQMCYVCRKDIGAGEGYRHFCEHFRPSAGRACAQCDKCDLYRCEDDEVAVRRAKEEAERRWREAGGENERVWRGAQRSLGAAPTAAAAAEGEAGFLGPGPAARWPRDWEAALDLVVEMLIE